MLFCIRRLSRWGWKNHLLCAVKLAYLELTLVCLLALHAATTLGRTHHENSFNNGRLLEKLITQCPLRRFTSLCARGRIRAAVLRLSFFVSFPMPGRNSLMACAKGKHTSCSDCSWQNTAMDPLPYTRLILWRSFNKKIKRVNHRRLKLQATPSSFGLWRRWQLLKKTPSAQILCHWWGYRRLQDLLGLLNWWNPQRRLYFVAMAFCEYNRSALLAGSASFYIGIRSMVKSLRGSTAICEQHAGNFAQALVDELH